MRYRIIDLIEEVLLLEKREMTIKEIWGVAITNSFEKKLNSIGKTPLNTINACIHRELSHNTKFQKKEGRPPRFYFDNI